MPASERRGLFLKLLLSVGILFHLLVMIVMPNGASYAGRRLQPVIGAYGAIIGLNVSWNFFSPDPAHTMYLKFTIYFEDDQRQELSEPIEVFFPAEKDQGVWDLGRRRELYSMRYMIIDPRRVDLILGPWMCRAYPGASSVRIEHVVNAIPSLDEVVLFREREVHDMSREYDFISKEFRCERGGEETP